MWRDFSIIGISVGSTIGNSVLEHVELHSGNCCEMAYATEFGYVRASGTTYNSPILCIVLKCTYGFKNTVTVIIKC